MPIISNANHDFTNYSVSSDNSSLDRFFTEIPETETVKGVYYQRAQLLRNDPNGAWPSVDHTLQVLLLLLLILLLLLLLLMLILIRIRLRREG